MPAPVDRSVLIPFIATFRCIINSPDEVEANVAADRLQHICMDWLDADDGDEVKLTQVTKFSSEVEPQEVVIILKRARNALIRTRYKDCYLLAQELDKVCHVLNKRGDVSQLLASYAYDKFLDTAAAILEDGKDPIE